MNGFVVAGIGTEVGKTVASAILAQHLGADYWKPMQAGDLHHTDTDKVRSWVTNPQTKFHPEAYRLQSPMSPHAAAAIDGVSISVDRLMQLPNTANRLLIELAGGLMVPLNERDLAIDWLARLRWPVILVSRYYLGSINHTLLSLYALQQRNIPIAGILFNDHEVRTTREAIAMQHPNVPCLGHIPFKEPSKEMVAECAKYIQVLQ